MVMKWVIYTERKMAEIKKIKKILAMGKEGKKCWGKADKDVSWGRNKIKKICNSRQHNYRSASLVMASL